MPWYWSDDVARVLLADGRIDPDTAARLTTTPVAIRRPETDVQSAALGLQDDGEIPLAA
jgi:hypothetical protein